MLDDYSFLRRTIREGTNRQRFFREGVVQEGTVWVETFFWVGNTRGELSGGDFFVGKLSGGENLPRTLI